MTRLLALLIPCFVLTAMAPAATAGSGPVGDLRGIVRDPLAQPIAGATVEVRDADQQPLRTVLTDPGGRFLLPALPQGHHQLAASFPGFATSRRAVAIGDDPVELEIRLHLQELRHTLTVAAEPGRVASIGETSQRVNVLTASELQDRAVSVVAEAVEGEPGLQLQRTSPTIAGVFVRGLGGKAVSEFVDGVRFSTAADRGGIKTFLSLVDPATLGGLEVLRGPQGAQYGSGSLGGSVHLLSRAPQYTTTGRAVRYRTRLEGTSSHDGFGVGQGIEWAAANAAVTVDLYGRRINPVRTGGGQDHHGALPRFLGIDSRLLGDELPDTGFTAYGGALRADLEPAPGHHLSLRYRRGQQDGGKRYDQLLGGDGDALADLRDLKLDLGSLRYETSAAPGLDSFSLAASFNRQREERVSQRGHGSLTEDIRHEGEATTALGLTTQARRGIGPIDEVTFGAEIYREQIDASQHRRDPVTGAISVVRPRIPDGALYDSAAGWLQVSEPLVPQRLRLTGAIRLSGASYRTRASDSPLVRGLPLWEDADLDFADLTYRAGLVWTPHQRLRLSGNWSRGFRTPSATDLGTLGLTGSGFEVAPAALPGRAWIGSTADGTASATGVPVGDLTAETSRAIDGNIELTVGPVRLGLGAWVNDLDGAIEKRTLLLEAGAVGTSLGGETIVRQQESGAVFIDASSTPVLVRANIGEVRLWGLEQSLELDLTAGLRLSQSFTWLRAKDRTTGAPPEISGGTPAPDGSFTLRYDAASGGYWLSTTGHGVLRQSRLSTLALQDRRIGGFRSAADIAEFFAAGATVRGLVGPGADGRLGTDDDLLRATGETLGEVTRRVLGDTPNGAPLFDSLPGYFTMDLQAGWNLAKGQRLVLDLRNLTDANYRGMAWGMPGPGRGLHAHWEANF